MKRALLKRLLLLLLLAGCCGGRLAAQQRIMDTAGIQILFAGALPGCIPKDSIIKNPFFTTNIPGLNVVGFILGANCKHCDYFGSVEITGNRFPANMIAIDPYRWWYLITAYAIELDDGRRHICVTSEKIWYVKEMMPCQQDRKRR